MSLPIQEAVPAALPPLYRTIWRWHFYAGLLVMPFMILLAVTGGIYLLKDEVNNLFYGSYFKVAPQPQEMLSPSTIIAKALVTVPGNPTAFTPPAAGDRAAVVTIKSAVGKDSVYVNPYDGLVLGKLSDAGLAGTPFMKLVRKIHSLDYFGWVANRVIEIVAGWAIILVVTGIYLWLPRGRDVGAFKVRPGARRRPFWRDLHAVTGIYTGLVILFLALTGLPWSGFWGDKINAYANKAGLGYPIGYWEGVPVSTVPMKDAMSQINWAMENAPMPQSTPAATAGFDIDQAVAAFQQLGIQPGYVIDLPQSPEGVYSASVYPDDISLERIIHLDRYSGKVLFDAGFKDLGLVGQAIEWGVSVHMGQEFGRTNQLLMLAACIAIVLMCVSALAMWWQRRPKGSLGAPRTAASYRLAKGVLVIAAAFGLVFPLTGLSILIALAFDYLFMKGLRTKQA